tara:strand:- start:2 stop:496 length:495 start_codon:yes stop_codon:yes gene_type:complete
MNLREKFIWNVAIGFSSIILIYCAWNQYSNHSKVSKAYTKFKNEKVGSDDELQNMVADLEGNLSKRQNLKFIPKDNPLDLMKVVSLSGVSNSRGIKGIDCQTAWSNEEGGFTALCSYKSQRHQVKVGDPIGGGTVTEITATKVFIDKDDQIIMFNFGLDAYEEN